MQVCVRYTKFAVKSRGRRKLEQRNALRAPAMSAIYTPVTTYYTRQQNLSKIKENASSHRATNWPSITPQVRTRVYMGLLVGLHFVFYLKYRCWARCGALPKTSSADPQKVSVHPLSLVPCSLSSFRPLFLSPATTKALVTAEPRPTLFCAVLSLPPS